MPTINENWERWDQNTDWSKQGDEWSNYWGGPDMQWYGMILPRIHSFLPVKKILEIAPGYGRWTQFLKNLCGELVVVDLSGTCIEACRKRFSDSSNISYYVNDGKSLDMISDNSIDFVFSFDSLVHANEIVMANYISQLSRKLTKNGVAFLHHSNLGEYPFQSRIQKIPVIRYVLKKLCIIEESIRWRDPNITNNRISQFAIENDLKCIAQEVVNWGTRRVLLDCFSTIVRKNSIWTNENRVLRNPHLMDDANYLSTLASIYTFNRAV
jgi:ubiquinone/menaquinone biosynthesis C-methylase UbiE